MGILQPKDFTEELLAKLVGIYFNHLGWDLFPEVKLSWFPGRPDYVCAKDSLIMAVECKKSLSYEVIEQLFRWREVNADEGNSLKGVPHLLYAASFAKRTSDVSGLKSHLLTSNRIGYIAVVYDGESWRDSSDLHISTAYSDQISFDLNGQRWTIRKVISAKVQPGSRWSAHRLFTQLDQDMKRAVSGVSGAVGGNYSTPFRRTLMKAVSVLEEKGECHIQNIVEEMNYKHGGHHYATDNSAKQSISKFLREFSIAESINGLPVFRLLPDYKSRIYASETESQRIAKEQKVARLAREKARREARRQSAPFWESF